MTDTKEPTALVVGDSAAWTKSLSSYLPADGWVLTYGLVNAKVKYSIAATDNGDGSHLATLPTSVTSLWLPGICAWQAVVTKAAERYTVASGQITVGASYSNGETVDERTHVRRTLEALEAVLEGRATSDQLGYSIGGRSITKMSPEQLLQWRDKYKAELAAEIKSEQIASGMSAATGTIRVRF